ncbi:hypothetical protein ACFYWX_05255 [Streptomyces sp. NPDC002888]|uniref:hypothetical protein n=1 Tax=Streptomyces sp. NPDC002888 TaxID=3364668 RepID=UPI00367B1066
MVEVGEYSLDPAVTAVGGGQSELGEEPYDDEALGTLGPGTPQVSEAWQTPWRFVAVARTAAQVAGTTLATDLGVPCRLDDTSWVRPGAATFSWMMDHNSPKSLEQTLR